MRQFTKITTPAVTQRVSFLSEFLAPRSFLDRRSPAYRAGRFSEGGSVVGCIFSFEPTYHFFQKPTAATASPLPASISGHKMLAPVFGSTSSALTSGVGVGVAFASPPFTCPVGSGVSGCVL